MLPITGVARSAKTTGDALVRPAVDRVVHDASRGIDVAYRLTEPAGEVTERLVFQVGMDVLPHYADEFAAELARNGIATHVLASRTELAPRLQDHALDIASVYEEAKRAGGGRLPVVGGESMGADTALYWNRTFNPDRTAVLAMPASIQTNFRALPPKEFAKVLGSLFSTRLAAEKIVTPGTRGLEQTKNVDSPLHASNGPFHGVQARGNFRDSALQTYLALLKPGGGPTHYVIAGDDADVINGATHVYQWLDRVLHRQSTKETIEGAAHVLTQEPTGTGRMPRSPLYDSVISWIRSASTDRVGRG